mmetsp:Transcript_62479/g.143181  ORF Transcript_62479/g.143181 Transcript_62479/m.143181 type:complete len:238 (-) Transcript_62479:957-1670(-)
MFATARGSAASADNSRLLTMADIRMNSAPSRSRDPERVWILWKALTSSAMSLKLIASPGSCRTAPERERKSFSSQMPACTYDLASAERSDARCCEESSVGSASIARIETIDTCRNSGPIVMRDPARLRASEKAQRMRAESRMGRAAAGIARTCPARMRKSSSSKTPARASAFTIAAMERASNASRGFCFTMRDIARKRASLCDPSCDPSRVVAWEKALTMAAMSVAGTSDGSSSSAI